MATDKKTIGIASNNSAGLATLTAAGHFASELDAAKFAMAHAVKSGVRPGSTENSETKWNVGSVDPDGSLRSLIEALFPDATEPYRAIEFFMNEGIRDLTGRPGSTADLYSTLFPPRASAQ